MKNFSRGGGFGDRKSSGGGFGRRDGGFSRGGRDSGARPEMHRAICADCGESCEVPFRPSGDKPVYCSNCFKGKDNAPAPRRDFGNKPSFEPRRDSNPSKEQFEMLNAKLDRILKALEKKEIAQEVVEEVVKEAKKVKKAVVAKVKKIIKKKK